MGYGMGFGIEIEYGAGTLDRFAGVLYSSSIQWLLDFHPLDQ